MPQAPQGKKVQLPKPGKESGTTLEEALSRRRSVRHFADRALELKEISRLLWAAQGITGAGGFRTAPSAGALYPLEVYLVSEKIDDLAAGIYRYNPSRHELIREAGGDFRQQLCRAALSQSAVCDAPVSFVITGVMERTTAKYGKRGIQYVFMEAGHAAQNLLLACVSLDLGAVPVGAFSNESVQRILDLEKGAHPLYIVPVGEQSK